MSTRDMNIKAIDQALSKRILLISDGFQTYTGSPAELIEEIANALPNYPEMIATAFKKVFPPEILDLIVAYAILKTPNVDWSDVL